MDKHYIGKTVKRLMVIMTNRSVSLSTIYYIFITYELRLTSKTMFNIGTRLGLGFV